MLEFLIFHYLNGKIPKSRLVYSVNTMKDPDNNDSSVSDISESEICMLNLEQARR